jgi:hypothetical protein
VTKAQTRRFVRETVERPERRLIRVKRTTQQY